MKFCPYCGYKFTETGWPLTCSSCKQTSYRNPIPVAVGLVPVIEKGRYTGSTERDIRAATGLLVVRRSIQPQIGHLALPGGYLEFGETWEHGVARECREEADYEPSEDGISPFLIRTSPKGLLLIFGLCEVVPVEKLRLADFKPNNEVSEIKVIYEPTDLAFPLHTEAANLFFRTRGQ